MKSTISTRFFTLALLAGLAMAPSTQAQFLDCSTVSIATPAGVTAVLYNLPNGQGSPLTGAGSIGGIVDATITLTLRDLNCEVVANFAAADMWLEKSVAAGTGNFVMCMGGTIADRNTDANGVTTWTAPLRAGGWSTSRTMVVVNGGAITSSPGVLLSHNSPDINGDETANLADIPLFASDYAGGSHPLRSDLLYDGLVNLSDIPRLAAGIGADCR